MDKDTKQATLAELGQQRDILEDRILNIVSQILDELELRLREFAETAGEKLFKSHPHISRQLTPDSLAQFKRELRQATEEQIAALIGTLADEDYWLLSTGVRGRESLQDNVKVWEIIQQFSQALTPVFKKYGYPAKTGTLMAPYPEVELKSIQQIPHSDQIKLLCVKYWFYLTKYTQISLEIKKQTKQANDQRLEALWKSVN